MRLGQCLGDGIDVVAESTNVRVDRCGFPQRVGVEDLVRDGHLATLSADGILQVLDYLRVLRLS